MSKKELSYPLVNRDEHTPSVDNQIRLKLNWEKLIEYQTNRVSIIWVAHICFDSKDYTVKVYGKTVTINIKI